MLSPVQTDATLLNVTCCICLHTLLHVVGCCCVLLHKVCTRSNFSANNFQHFFCSVITDQSVAQQCWIRLHSSSNIVGATNVHYAWFTKTLGCILPTMHCRSQHCWELLHPFAHHCQHPRNNVGSCCIRLQTTANTHATMLGVVASVCRPLPTCMQQLPTLLAQQCWELFRLFARSLNAQCNLLYFSKTHKAQCSKANWCLHFSLLSIILADLLGNRTLL